MITLCDVFSSETDNKVKCFLEDRLLTSPSSFLHKELNFDQTLKRNAKIRKDVSLEMWEHLETHENLLLLEIRWAKYLGHLLRLLSYE